ncbi:DUF1223 domain-containing protein [Roseibaca sp. Y0-43]|nr:DUF1223 domain-containing protein [Roseibaca sp. Y0-43]
MVVELYTSQGCAACPPADELLNQMAQHEEILPLALHVDYWDYIGWADTFGQTQFSERQKSYARRMGRKSVYTPQMVIGGVHDVQGNAAMQVMGLLAEHRMNPIGAGRVSVRIAERAGGGVTITAQSTGVLDYATDVQLVRFLDRATVEIESGENAGREITYRNIVTDWNVLGTWDGAQAFSYTVTDALPDGTGLAVVVQEQGLGPVLGAARYP